MKLEWRDVALTTAGPSISTSLTEREIAELSRLAAGSKVLEIGSAYGYSATAMALAGGDVLAVDPHAWLNSYSVMLNNLEAYGVADRVQIRCDSSWSVMPQLLAQGIKFDLVWIDGDHEAPTVAHDVDYARQLLKENGTLACHDFDEDTCPGVRIALEAWKLPPTLIDTLAIYGPGEW